MRLTHCIFKKQDKIFCIKRNDKPLKGIFSLPGGKIENEKPEQALQREIKEELGLNIFVSEKDFLGKINYRTKDLNFSVSYFKTDLDENKIKLNKKEISGTMWLPIPGFCENLLKAGLNKESVEKLSVLLKDA